MISILRGGEKRQSEKGLQKGGKRKRDCPLREESVEDILCLNPVAKGYKSAHAMSTMEEGGKSHRKKGKERKGQSRSQISYCDSFGKRKKDGATEGGEWAE